jgi:hypothetical protein
VTAPDATCFTVLPNYITHSFYLSMSLGMHKH